MSVSSFICSVIDDNLGHEITEQQMIPVNAKPGCYNQKKNLLKRHDCNYASVRGKESVQAFCDLFKCQHILLVYLFNCHNALHCHCLNISINATLEKMFFQNFIVKSYSQFGVKLHIKEKFSCSYRIACSSQNPAAKPNGITPESLEEEVWMVQFV